MAFRMKLTSFMEEIPQNPDLCVCVVYNWCLCFAMLLFPGLQVEAAEKRVLLQNQRKEHLGNMKQRLGWQRLMLLSNLQQGST